MDKHAHDLVVLKKVCKELQKELAFASPDIAVVVRLADEALYLADCIATWARAK